MMCRLYNRAIKILVAVISAIVQIANIFVGNIIVYETTEGVSFNWLSLLRSPMFWIVVAVDFLYFYTGIIIVKKSNLIDDKIAQAIEESQIKLIDTATKCYTEKDYDSGDKMLKAFDKIGRRKK